MKVFLSDYKKNNKCRISASTQQSPKTATVVHDFLIFPEIYSVEFLLRYYLQVDRVSLKLDMPSYMIIWAQE